jgi:trigger factor
VSVLSIDPVTYEAGKPFTYTAEIEVPPPVEPKEFKGLKLNKTIRELDEKQVEERLERLRESMASLDPISEDRTAQAGDHLVVDIKADTDGETIPSLTVSDYHLEMGRNFYLPDFDHNLEGLKVDETKKLALELPEDFPRKDLAGKTANIEVTIKEAKVQVLPDLDDDFAKDLGSYDTLDALKEEIRQDIRRMLENETTKEMRDQVVDQLVEAHDIDVPDSMVENQIDGYLNQTFQNLAAQGIDPKQLPPPTKEQRDHFRPQALRMVKAGLVLKAIGEKEGIEVSDEEVDEAIEKRAKSMGFSADLLKDRWKENNMLEEVRAALVEDKIYDLIEEHAVITEIQPPAEDDSKQEESGSE